MANTDAVNNTLNTQTVAPQIVTAGTITGSTIDLLGRDNAAFLLNFGAIVAAGLVTVAFQESDDNFGSNNVIAAADLQGAMAAIVQNTSQKVGYRGGKRYIRAVVTYVSGTSVGVQIGVVSIRDLSLLPTPNIA